jgi:uncharacterized protein (DUF433 family)
MIALESISHIVRDDKGIAWLDKANVKVIDIALDHVAYGWSADEIHEQHPHLSLAQIYAALACYYDHQSEFDAEIAKGLKEVRQLRISMGDSPLQRRLRTLLLSQ